jgi:CRP-like cAMP-binding protein
MTTASTIPTLDSADRRSAAGRTPIPEIIEALKRVPPLHGMEHSEYEWLATHGIERLEPAGTTLFHEGDPATTMNILLKGEIHVRRGKGAPAAFFIGRTGLITGLLPFSRMKTYGGHGYVVTDAWSLDFDRQLFPEMLREVPSMAQRCVSVLLDRVREITRLEQQTEKLNALGKLAGNLAHEMNNPASAAQRAASGLLEELRVYGQEKFKLGSLCLDEKHLLQVRKWQEGIREQARAKSPDPVQHAANEDKLQAWLRDHGVRETWKVAPELAELGVTAEQLNPLGEVLNSDSLSIVLAQFASSVRAERIAEAMLDSTARIFDLIRAIKDYSYMDQAPIQEVDVRQALENRRRTAAYRRLRQRAEPGLDGAARKRPRCHSGPRQDHAQCPAFRRNAPHRSLGQRSRYSRGSAGSHLRALFHNQGSRLRPRPWFGYCTARCSPPPWLHPRAVRAGRNMLPGAAAH